MENIDRLLLLMDLEKKLKYIRYNELGLISLDRLRFDIEVEIEKIKNEQLSRQPIG
jgi:hypothetical protein